MIHQIKNAFDLLLYIKSLSFGEFVSFAEIFTQANPGVLKLYCRVYKWTPKPLSPIEHQALKHLGIYPHSVCQFVARLPDDAYRVLFRILGKLRINTRFLPARTTAVFLLTEKGMVNQRGLVPTH